MTLPIIRELEFQTLSFEHRVCLWHGYFSWENSVAWARLTFPERKAWSTFHALFWALPRLTPHLSKEKAE